MSAAVSFIGMRNRGIYENGFQGELHGKGSLSIENKDMLEFRAVSPNQLNSVHLPDMKNIILIIKSEFLCSFRR